MTDIHVGDTVRVGNNQGIVRYADETDFQPGVWIGVEFASPVGKNDGSVGNKRYFSCKPAHGMFAKPGNVTVVQKARASAANGRMSVNGAATKPGRPSSGIIGDATKKRQSIAPSPTAGSRLSIRSPTKSPTKSVTSPTTSGSSTPRVSTPGGGRPSLSAGTRPRASVGGARQSMGPPPPPSQPSRLSRQSLAPQLKADSTRTTDTTPRSSGGHSSLDTTEISDINSNITEEEEEPPTEDRTDRKDEEAEVNMADDTVVLRNGSKAPTSRAGRPEALKPPVKPSPERSRAPVGSLADRPSANGNESVQMAAKLRMMEKKRMEDREKLKALDRVQEERDRYKVLIQELQQKIQPIQQELNETKLQLEAAEARVDQVDRIEAEKTSELELATLDREMAEETAEAYKADLEATQLRLQEVEEEMELLRDVNNAYDEEAPAADKSSHGWMQLEREKDRYREALIKMREVSMENDAELKVRVVELEANLGEFDDMRKKYDDTKEHLKRTKADIATLVEQLEAAEDQEEMIENLTEEKAQLQEERDIYRNQVRDLKDIEALNEEMEADNQATQRELQSELDFRESIIVEHKRQFHDHMRHIEDLEFMIGKYKETVGAVQKEIETMRESRQISEAEAKELNETSRALMDLKMKYTTSENKVQMKKIDMELARLKAEESTHHLSIIQHFLTDSFERDRTPIETLLRFNRIASKAVVMATVLRDQSAARIKDISDALLKFEIEEKLQWIMGTCTRFYTFGSNCTVDEFVAMAQALYDLEPIERNFDIWLETLRTNELDRRHCVVELSKFKAVLGDLSEKFIPSSLATEADALHCQALMVHCYLETVAGLLPMIRDKIPDVVVLDEDQDSVAEASYFAERVQGIEFEARSTKVVASKVVNALDVMIQRSLSFTGASSETFEPTEALSHNISAVVRQIMTVMQSRWMDQEQENRPSYFDATKTMSDIAASSLQTYDQEDDIFLILASCLKTLNNNLSELATLASDLSRSTEFERRPAPWTVRAKELKATRELSAETEATLQRLQADLSDKVEVLASRDQQIEEQYIRIQLLESRTKDSKQQAIVVKAMEAEVEEAKKVADQASKIYSLLATEHEKLQRDRETDRKQLEILKRAQLVDGGDQNGLPQIDRSAALALEQQVTALKEEIENLQAAVRYLREENYRINMPLAHAGLQLENHSWLTTPLLRSKASSNRVQSKKLRAEAAAKETQHLFNSLLDATTRFRPVDLRDTLGDANTFSKSGATESQPKKSTWRSQKSTPKYQVLKQKEELERWDEWMYDLLKQESTFPNGAVAGVAARRRGGKRDPLTPRKGDAAARGGEDIVEIVSHSP